MHLFCDFETKSRTPISSGTHRYAEDPECEILLWGYAIDHEPAKVWQVGIEPMPRDLLTAIKTVQADPDSRHVWHNGLGFDLNVLAKVMPEYALPKSNCIDTMLRAYQHGLPGSLGDLSLVFGLPADKAKDRDGARLIRLFCIPQFDGHFNTHETHPEDWAKFVNYCRLDVEAERELFKKMPRFNATKAEQALMLLDQEINDRGFLVDVDLAQKAVAASLAEGDSLRAKTSEKTDGAVDSATRGKALMQYLNDTYGLNLKNLLKSEVERMLDRDDIPEPAKELLRIRLNSAKASTKKFQVILDRACADGRMRGCLQFRGASRTGRWSGRGFQPQNLPRPSMSDDQIEEVIAYTKADALDLLTDNAGDALSNCLRGTIIVPEGKRMVVADYSNIEGRVLAWVANESWKLQAFREFDAGTGLDLYKLTYSRAFNTDPHSVTKPQRQMGKVLELAMGYSGGAGAFATFARGYGIDLHDMAKAVMPALPMATYEEACEAYEWAAKDKRRLSGLDRDVWIACDSIKRLWRKSNPNIVSLWKAFDDAAIECLTTGKKAVIDKRIGLWFERRGSWLLMRLPSGRYLCYPAALTGAEDEQCTFTFMGVNQASRKWQRIKTFGGKLTENCIQAVACDVLANALFNVKAAGFDSVLTVHDEILTEAPDDEAHDHAALERAMEILPTWATGLPLAAAGFESLRYRK